jgi:tetratricopeptide (TPR) repeat protein
MVMQRAGMHGPALTPRSSAALPACQRSATALRLAAAMLLLALLSGGCATSGIGQARRQFYAGRLTEAGNALTEVDTAGKDAVLVLMERGMIHHASGNHASAIQDWLDAIARIQELDYVRLSEKTTSMVINDRTETYTGRPYERALLHAFTAKSYFALGQWREAAVEARLIADGSENLNGFPDDAYSRYVAGLAFELIRDFNGSRIEYARAEDLTPLLRIDPASGRIAPTNAPAARASDAMAKSELICLITIGRVPPYPSRTAAMHGTIWGSHPYAEIIHNGKSLGRSYTLNTTGNLAALTEKRIAAIKVAKTVARIVIKDSIANAVADNNPLLGEVLRLLLFALEMPDTRQWETLPHWLQVARVPCPQTLDTIEVVFRNAAGGTLRRIPIPATSLVRSGDKAIGILRVW